MDALTLSQADTRRLEKLASEAGRSPKDVLKHVLRDGFDATEFAIKAVKSRMQSKERVTHKVAMQQLAACRSSPGKITAKRSQATPVKHYNYAC